MTSQRTLSLTILIAAFIVAGSIWTRPAMGTKSLTASQGETAVVDVYHLVDILIMSEEASNERAEFEAQSSTQITAYEQQLIGIQTQMSGISQDDPQAAQLYNQYQQVSQAIQQATNQINADYQSLLAQQIANAYTTIHEAVNTVATEQNYTFVIATRRGADLVQTNTLTGVTQEILARPLVTPPESADMTEAVRVHLGLPTMEEITAQVEAEQAAADAAAQEQDAPAEPTPATEITDE